ncbi:hypothetical protein L0337_18385 [candidate division KSB1 bacterium]|nr:hypothetical protein [candidate division KSB1 bacterium]
MRKLIGYLQIALLLVAIALPVVGILYDEAAAVAPECNYTVCPGGGSMCCTEGGVTLYNWNPPPPPP